MSFSNASFSSKNVNPSSVRIGLMDPDIAQTWAQRIVSDGRTIASVKKGDTINHTTSQPIATGLFCQRIFGPCIDYTCACGHEKIRIHVNVNVSPPICPECHVEWTESSVRRQRLGSIELISPVTHKWFSDSRNYIPILAGITVKTFKSLKDCKLFFPFSLQQLETRTLDLKTASKTNTEFIVHNNVLKTEQPKRAMKVLQSLLRFRPVHNSIKSEMNASARKLHDFRTRLSSLESVGCAPWALGPLPLNHVDHRSKSKAWAKPKPEVNALLQNNTSLVKANKEIYVKKNSDLILATNQNKKNFNFSKWTSNPKAKSRFTNQNSKFLPFNLTSTSLLKIEKKRDQNFYFAIATRTSLKKKMSIGLGFFRLSKDNLTSNILKFQEISPKDFSLSSLLHQGLGPMVLPLALGGRAPLVQVQERGPKVQEAWDYGPLPSKIKNFTNFNNITEKLEKKLETIKKHKQKVKSKKLTAQSKKFKDFKYSKAPEKQSKDFQGKNSKCHQFFGNGSQYFNMNNSFPVRPSFTQPEDYRRQFIKFVGNDGCIRSYDVPIYRYINEKLADSGNFQTSLSEQNNLFTGNRSFANDPFTHSNPYLYPSGIGSLDINLGYLQQNFDQNSCDWSCSALSEFGPVAHMAQVPSILEAQGGSSPTPQVVDPTVKGPYSFTSNTLGLIQKQAKNVWAYSERFQKTAFMRKSVQKNTESSNWTAFASKLQNQAPLEVYFSETKSQAKEQTVKKILSQTGGGGLQSYLGLLNLGQLIVILQNDLFEMAPRYAKSQSTRGILLQIVNETFAQLNQNSNLLKQVQTKKFQRPKDPKSKTVDLGLKLTAYGKVPQSSKLIVDKQHQKTFESDPKDSSSEKNASNFTNQQLTLSKISSLSLKMESLEKKYKDLKKEYKVVKKICSDFQNRKNLTKRRYKLAFQLLRTMSNPAGMTLSCVPVLPPGLRPIIDVPKIGPITADLNIRYRGLIFALRNLRELAYVDFRNAGAAQASVQEAVDDLLYTGGKTRSTTSSIGFSGPNLYKSLAMRLKGKHGRFRGNLLGKRVDYSGRSVIVVGPTLKIHQCGLPFEIAIKLFNPFLIRRLIQKGLCKNVYKAKQILLEGKFKPLIWALCREVMLEHLVLLNRAPTLHRLGVQAFMPILISGRAILLHPLVCTGFNADFDGDQMGVHVPLFPQARAEAWKMMWSRNNFLSPSGGEPILLPSQDMVLGCYYLTESPLLYKTKATFNWCGLEHVLPLALDLGSKAKGHDPNFPSSFVRNHTLNPNNKDVSKKIKYSPFIFIKANYSAAINRDVFNTFNTKISTKPSASFPPVGKKIWFLAYNFKFMPSCLLAESKILKLTSVRGLGISYKQKTNTGSNFNRISGAAPCAWVIDPPYEPKAQARHLDQVGLLAHAPDAPEGAKVHGPTGPLGASGARPKFTPSAQLQKGATDSAPSVWHRRSKTMQVKDNKTWDFGFDETFVLNCFSASIKDKYISSQIFSVKSVLDKYRRGLYNIQSTVWIYMENQVVNKGQQPFWTYEKSNKNKLALVSQPTCGEEGAPQKPYGPLPKLVSKNIEAKTSIEVFKLKQHVEDVLPTPKNLRAKLPRAWTQTPSSSFSKNGYITKMECDTSITPSLELRITPFGMTQLLQTVASKKTVFPNSILVPLEEKLQPTFEVSSIRTTIGRLLFNDVLQKLDIF